MNYQCPQCGLPRTGNQSMRLAMPQCVCSWQFTPPQTPPPKREWVGLTGFEQKKLMAMSAREAVFATEDKLKEKNK